MNVGYYENGFENNFNFKNKYMFLIIFNFIFSRIILFSSLFIGEHVIYINNSRTYLVVLFYSILMVLHTK